MDARFPNFVAILFLETFSVLTHPFNSFKGVWTHEMDRMNLFLF